MKKIILTILLCGCLLLLTGCSDRIGKVSAIEITNSDVIINFVNDINRSPEELNKIFTQKIKDGKLLFGEGGSGIAKVNKILKRDLNNSENSISMIAEPGKCRTLVIIKLNGFKSV